MVLSERRGGRRAGRGEPQRTESTKRVEKEERRGESEWGEHKRTKRQRKEGNVEKGRKESGKEGGEKGKNGVLWVDVLLKWATVLRSWRGKSGML